MVIQSKALLVNLEETAVREVPIAPHYEVLREAVRDYQGISRALDQLLFELHHPYRNWGVLLRELRGFALKNLATYSRSPKAPEAIRVLLDTFLDAITTAPKAEHRSLAADGLLAFVEKVVQGMEGADLVVHLDAIEHAFRTLSDAEDTVLMAVARSFHSVPRLVRNLTEKFAPESGHQISASLWQIAGALLIRLREVTWQHWLQFEDPHAWLARTVEKHDLTFPEHETQRIRGLLEPVSHAHLKALLAELVAFREGPSDRRRVIHLAGLPGHLAIIRSYRQVAQQLGHLACRQDQGHETSLHLLFLFHLVEMEGLATIHEEILREINRSLICLVRTADLEQLKDVLRRSFTLLKQQVGHFPRTALQCIETLGHEVFRRDNSRLTEFFLEHVVHFGFETPQVRGVDTEWHILCNPTHLQNIRAWLSLIGQDPKQCMTLLSAMIVNLKLSGTCIRDTDLFQKDISHLLNCKIEPAYNLVKQLAKTLPVYFNEIGAEGLLRDVSTELDEICRRQDILIHFLRKQSHVESNNLIVDFIEAILCFWYGRAKAVLEPFVPPEILGEIQPYGAHVDHAHALIRHLAEALDLEPFARRVDRLLNLSEEEMNRLLEDVPDVPLDERRRVGLLIRMYRLENLKYKLGTQEIRHHLEEARNLGFEGLDALLKILDRDELEECLHAILNELEDLKGIILSSERFEAREDIYHKRHIAADIPSMYGRYHERKFDALSLTFRLENLANLHFERLIAAVELPFITRTTFARIIRCLHLFRRALELDGVHSKTFHTHLTLLEKSLAVRRFTFSQYLDIVRGLFEGVKDMIHVYYISPHRENLPLIVRQLGIEHLLPKYSNAVQQAENETQLVHQISERFLRDLISGTFGLQHLDNFMARVYQILGEQKEVLDPKDLDLLLTYDPDQTLCPIHTPSRRTNNLIHLGNKGYNLVLLAKESLPVPPGFVVTTEIFRCHSILQRFPRVYRDFCRQLRNAIEDIERLTGRRYGDPENPLLVSVRSGAAISMPGMMATIINVGSNIDTIDGLARRTGKPWFAWDNYRRFLQSWGMSFGLSREIFNELIEDHKHRHGIEKKREFTGEQMRLLALAYREAVLDHGLELEEDPFEQLLMSIRLVLGSWESAKARDYREIMEISDYWGTAVIVQAMAFGNMSEASGTGVVFSTNPHRKMGRVSLWGDFTPGNQGEDIVSGLVATYPISVEQRETTALNTETSLEESFPKIYKALLNHTQTLIYEKKWAPQEIEFTFEGPEADQLFILQTRDMTSKKAGKIQVFVPTPELEASYLGQGIGVSGGAFSGKVVFTLAEIEAFRARESSTPLILIRSDTVPEDIKEISMTDGLLTAKGGQTSHAAIVAFRLGKTCVVGCKQLLVFEGRGYAEIHNQMIHPGDYISIDGRNGTIFMGLHVIQEEEEASIA